jgi:hypothetical protein
VTKAFTTKNLHVMDLRSGSATFGNKISGNGGESNIKAYQNITFSNLNCDNIHGISKAFDLMSKISDGWNKKRFIKLIHDSYWMQHLSLHLRAVDQAGDH